MRRGTRAATVAVFGIVGLAIMTSGAIADTAALYLPDQDKTDPGVRVKLSADRMFGFVPMTVNLSGMVQTREGDLMPVNGGQTIRVVVESPLLQVQSSENVTAIANDMHYEAVTPGPVSPSAFRRLMEIRRPGHYKFRVQVIAPDGEVIGSNEISVRAL